MRISGRLLTLAFLLALAPASVHAQNAGDCPNPKEWRPSPEELRATLQAHEGWYKKEGWRDPTVPGRAILCNADLNQAQLQGANLFLAQLRGANLWRVKLQGADLWGANLQGAELLEAQVQGANLRDAWLQGASLAAARLQNADLSQAQVQGANLRDAWLQGADLREANLQDADLRDAQLQDAVLRAADLSRANLTGAKLRAAELIGTNLDGARLTNASLFSVQYEPATAPASGYLTGLKGLTTLRFNPGQGSGLVQLRARLMDAGLRDLERQATYALERQITAHKLRDWEVDRLSALEGAFRWLAFELPVGYGLYPGRALRVLLASIVAFALVYAFALATGTGRVYQVSPPGRVKEASDSVSLAEIYQVSPLGRVEKASGSVSLAEEGDVKRLPRQGILRSFIHGLWFSLLSAFHLGFRELNVGNWLARLQGREYGLQAVGWVRRVAGLQSLLSVYLLALWVLTYFGRPFG